MLIQTAVSLWSILKNETAARVFLNGCSPQSPQFIAGSRRTIRLPYSIPAKNHADYSVVLQSSFPAKAVDEKLFLFNRYTFSSPAYLFMAFMSGKMKISGDMGLALKLQMFIK